MITQTNRNEIRRRIHTRIREKLSGTTERPRLNVFRSLNHIYAQVIDDQKGETIVAASSLQLKLKSGGNVAAAKEIADIPGLVYCRRNNLLCYLAGKPFAVDDFKTAELVATGAMTPQELQTLLQQRHIAIFDAPQGTRAADIPSPRLF